jgi:hypothetical protein
MPVSILTDTLINLHPINPEWILITGQELINARQQVWPFFLDYCLKRNPLPEFEGSFSEKQRKIADYFQSTFTREKDLVLRAVGNSLTGFVVFDPQNWSLEGEFPDRTVELVIAGSNSKNPWLDKKDFRILAAAYKNHKGCSYIGMNVRREWKGDKFKNFCQRLGFKESGGLFLL